MNYYFRILRIDNELNAVTRFWSDAVSEDDLALSRNPDGSIIRSEDGSPVLCKGDCSITLFDAALVQDQQALRDYISVYTPTVQLDHVARLKAGTDTDTTAVQPVVNVPGSRQVTNPRYVTYDKRFIVISINGKDCMIGPNDQQTKGLLSQAGVALADVPFQPTAQVVRDQNYIVDANRVEWIDKLKNATLAEIDTFVRGKINADAVVDLASAKACIKRIETAFVVLLKVLAPRIQT